jgi:hypothetical protein
MSIMFLGACPEARVVSTAKLHERLSWPLSIFENALHQYPALEVLGPFKFAEGDTKSEIYFLSQIVLTLTLFLSYREKLA